MVVLRSPHAHARITRIDTAEARKAPGVVAVYTAAELKADGVGHIPSPPLFKRPDGGPMGAPPRTPLADGVAFYAGHPVAAIIAETRLQAQDAAELISIEYQELPAVVNPQQAIEAGAPQIWMDAPGNISAQVRYGDAAAVAAAMARAAHVTELALHNQRVSAVPLEPRCALAEYGGERWTLYTQTQQPTGTRDRWPRCSRRSRSNSASWSATWAVSA
jgi:carbon-monoxide dehydrogenase large subunit